MMPVLSEIATLMEAMHGTNIARFGHGELAIMNGMDSRYQQFNAKLAGELYEILFRSECLVCVPHREGKRAWEWDMFLGEYGKFIDANKWYGSSFISRADEAEWLLGYDLLSRRQYDIAVVHHGVKVFGQLRHVELVYE